MNLHMTLRFIGEVENPEVADITAALSSVEAKSFDLMLSGQSGKIILDWV